MPADPADRFRQLAEEPGAWRDAEESGTARPSVRALTLLADLLHGPPAGDSVPPGWHLVALPTWPSIGELGVDGHPAHGLGFPPITPRRRMFAGGRLSIGRGLDVDRPVTWRRRVSDVTHKTGRSGDLLFVTIETAYSQGSERPGVIEQQDVVYRGPSPRAGAPEPAPPSASAPGGDSDEVIRLAPDAVTLFRFSALTGNSHRIHYDERFAIETEELPGRVVHGPLMAALMLEPVRRDGRHPVVSSFRYRAVRPAIAGVELVARIRARTGRNWDLAVDSGGDIAMTGTVTVDGDVPA